MRYGLKTKQPLGGGAVCLGLGAGLLGGGGGQDFARTVEGVDDVAVDVFLPIRSRKPERTMSMRGWAVTPESSNVIPRAVTWA